MVYWDIIELPLLCWIKSSFVTPRIVAWNKLLLICFFSLSIVFAFSYTELLKNKGQCHLLTSIVYTLVCFSCISSSSVLLLPLHMLSVMLYPGSANCWSSPNRIVIKTSTYFISDDASKSCGYWMQNYLFQYFCLVNCEQVAWYVTVFYLFLDMFFTGSRACIDLCDVGGNSPRTLMKGK